MTDAQTAHIARNAAAKAARQARAVERFLAHTMRNNLRSEDAAALRATRREMNASIHADTNAAQSAARIQRREDGKARHAAHNAGLHEAKVRDVAAQLLERSAQSAATAATAQSPVTAKVYAMDARHTRKLAASVLSTIGERLPRAA